MAELGDFFNSNSNSNADNVKIEIEMLDYHYVQECNDCNKLQAILKVLKSGKEGYYPDLIRVTEEKMINLLPLKEKKKYLALNHKTTQYEIAEATSDITNWETSAMMKDKTIVTNAKTIKDMKKVIPVRGNNSLNRHTGDIEVKGSPKEHHHDNDSNKNKLHISPVDNLILSENEDLPVIIKILSFLNLNQRKKIETLRKDLNVAELNKVKRQYKSNLEKIKGNESFRVADNNDAILCYSKSIAYDIQNPLVWANRAMAYIRQELFDLAEADSTVAIYLDPNYAKAYSRRGLVRFKRGKYIDAVDDFKKALEFDPQNKELQTLLTNAKDKYFEVEGTSYINSEDHSSVGGVITDDHSATAEAGMIGFDILPIKSVERLGQLLLPNSLTTSELLYEGILQREETVPHVASVPDDAPTGFVRINVIADDTDDSDESDVEEVAISSKQTESKTDTDGYKRVVISEDSEDEEEEEEQQPNKEDQAATLKELGNKLMTEGKISEAITVYSESLAILSSYVPSLNNRAQAYLLIKDYDGTIADSSSVLQIEPANIKALYRRASALLNKGLIQQSKSDVDVMLSIDPTNKQALKLIEMLQLATVDAQLPPPPIPTTIPLQTNMPPPVPTSLPPAVPVSSKQADEIDVQSLKQKAQQYLADGLYDKVIALLTSLLDSTTDSKPTSFSSLIESDQSSLLHLLASAYVSIGGYIQAIHSYDAILRMDPTNFRALLKKAESQLIIAKELTSQSHPDREQVLEKADTYISSALKIYPDNVDILALRQQLLRQRNISHPVVTPSSSMPSPTTTAATTDTDSNVAANYSSTSSSSSSSRYQSDLQKDLGNKAMADKSYSTAVMHYSNAIKIDTSNIAAYNNRSLAHLKLKVYTLAEVDATVVIDQVGGHSERNEENQNIYRKALCRRAQAKKGLADEYMTNSLSITNKSNTTSTLTVNGNEKKKLLLLAQDKYREAQTDLNVLLRSEPSNKTVLTEQKQIKDSLKKCQEALAPIATISNNNNSATSSTSSKSSSPAATAPRANANHISQLLSPASPQSFDSIGMVARSVKKFNPDGTTTTSIPIPIPTATIDNAIRDENIVAASSSDNKEVKPTTTPISKINRKSSASSHSITSPGSGGSTLIPTDLPKTVYEFERVWRGLKDQPENFAKYICSFKKSTFKKVVKDSTSPDLLSFMWIVIKDHVIHTPQVQFKILLGFSLINNFSLTLSLLPAKDLKTIQDIFDNIYKDNVSDMNSFIELAKQYNINKY